MKERPVLLTSLVILLVIVGVIIRILGEPDTVPFETQPATHLVEQRHFS